MEPRFSKLAQNYPASGIRKMFNLAAQYPDAIKLTVGEPNFDTPAYIREAAKKAIDDGYTHYSPNAGMPVLREAIANKYKKYWDGYTAENVIVSVGALEGLTLALMTLIDPGDEIIVPDPCFPNYFGQAQIVGATAVPVPTYEENDYRIQAADIEKAITPKTKAIILNNPSNPTGMIYSRAHLEAIAQVIVEEDLYVIADEMYSKLVFDGQEFVSFPSLGEEVKARTILANGASKTYAMTGWRIGFACASQEIIKIMSNYFSHSLSGTCSIAQAASVEAFAGSQAEVEAMRQTFEDRRNYLYERMNRIEGVHPVHSQATFYMLMNIEKLIGKTLYGVTIRDADDFAQVFLKEGLVALVPCTGFGAPHYLRWSFAVSMENIKAGLDRLEKFLAEG